MSVKVLSIAGFDPSGGAGVLQDAKTFEAHQINGYAVSTSITFQNESEFDGLHWIKIEDILKQLESVLKSTSVDVVKIGLIENLDVLNAVIPVLMNKNPEVKIVWDPILKATAGYQFHSTFETIKLKKILDQMFLVTPNQDEKIYFLEHIDSCSILVKGELEDDKVLNKLYIEGRIVEFETERVANREKHGTGCIFSSSLVASLSLGKDIETASRLAQKHTLDYMKSSETLLGLHKMENVHA
ncbi:MAG: bifunctional hydroxymethylpyrimidine kinase/phosphomethylpyrimidine kinase [Flavobacteriales bacterium]|nr:bifunctional hydroxymethylpyrimidine kinase/phosphomethylpyrimidine kinase [Flavobacteriales bacterium]